MRLPSMAPVVSKTVDSNMFANLVRSLHPTGQGDKIPGLIKLVNLVFGNDKPLAVTATVHWEHNWACSSKRLEGSLRLMRAHCKMWCGGFPTKAA